MRFASRNAARLLAAGLLLANGAPLFAQDGQRKPANQVAQEQKPEQKQPGQKQAEQKPPEQKPDDQKPPEQETPEQQALKRAIEEFAEAADRLAPAAGVAECVWTGRRITTLLWRDDIDTARRYMDLYDRFGCSGEHLKLSFRCLVKQGPLDPKAADRLAERVHACWVSPKEPDSASSQAIINRPVKGGTVAN